MFSKAFAIVTLMNLSLTDALAIARKWDQEAAQISAMVLTNSSELVIKFAGRVSVSDDAIMLTSGDKYELRLTLIPTMIFLTGDSLLEIRGLGWSCVLSPLKPQ